MKGYNNSSDIVIQGYWDGQPIWRERTAQEKLYRFLMEERYQPLLDEENKSRKQLVKEVKKK